MQLLNSAPFSNRSVTFFLPNGSYAGFLIAYRGTNNATAKTRADVGNVNLTFNGNPIINVDFELLSYLADLKGGVSTFVSTISGTLKTMIYVPAGKFNDSNNVYLITDKDKAYFKLDFGNLADITGNVYIYGIPKMGIMNYQYCLTSRNVSMGGAGTQSDVHRLANVSAVYLKNTSIIDSIQLQRDRQTVVDGLTPDVQALSDFYNQVEASNTLIEIDMNRSQNPKEILSQEILFKYAFNAGGLLQQYFAYSIFTPDSARISAVKVHNDIKAKIDSGQIPVNDANAIRGIATDTGSGATY